MAARRKPTRRRRRKPRIPSRAARRAQSPQPSRGIELWYVMQLKRLLRPWQRELKRRALKIADQLARKEEGERTDGLRLDASQKAILAELKGSLQKVLTKSQRRQFLAAMDTVAKRTKKHNQSEFQRVGLRIREAEPKLGPMISKWRRSNVQRVTDITKRQTSQLAKLLAEHEGSRHEVLADIISERLDISTRKAELVARNETLNLNAQINHARQKAAGVERYVWTTSNDERVRGRPDGAWPDADPSHWDLEGKTFSFDDPPESGVNGERLNPGEPINCRCIAFPVIPQLDD